MSLQYRDDEFHGCAVIVQDLNPVPKACGDKFRPGQQRGVRWKDRRHRGDNSQETLNETRETNSLLLSRLTVKLRGRARTPDGAEGAQFLSARGAKPQAHHGPLQRLLGGGAAR
jgi:hypothetical protein